MLLLKQKYDAQIIVNAIKIKPYLVLPKKAKYISKQTSRSLNRKIFNSRPVWIKINNKPHVIFTLKRKNLSCDQILFYNAKRRRAYGKVSFLFWTKQLVNLRKNYKTIKYARYVCKRFIKIKRRYYRSQLKRYARNLKYKRKSKRSSINQYSTLKKQNKHYQKYSRKRRYRVFVFKYKRILNFFRKKKYWWVKSCNSEQFKFHYTYKSKPKIRTKYLRQNKKNLYTVSKHLCFKTFRSFKALQTLTQNQLSTKHLIRFHNYILYKRFFTKIQLKKQYKQFFIKGSSIVRDFNWGMRSFKKKVLYKKRPAFFYLHNFPSYLHLYPTRYIKNPWLQSLLYTGRRSWINNKSRIKRFKNPLREKRNKIYHFFDKYLYPRREYGLYPLKKHFFRLKQLLKKIILPFYGHLTYKQIKKISKKKVNIKSQQHDRTTLFTSQLERRLDVLVYRMNLAPTILQAKQFILYGSVYVSNTRILHTDLICQLDSLFPLGDSTYLKTFSNSIRPLKTNNKAMYNINHLVKPKEVVHINPYVGSLLKAPYVDRKVFNKPSLSYMLLDTHTCRPNKTPWIIQKKRFMKHLPNIFSNKQFNNYSGVFTILPAIKVLPRTDRIKIPLLHTLIN